MLYVIDLFCGAGGFSEGARRAGATVILAVDCWQMALDVHALNHPDVEHWLEELGEDPREFADRLRRVIADKAPPGGRVHLHASPPCQNLCGANRRRSEDEGMRLVEWSFRVAEALGSVTVTVEQVASPVLLRAYSHLPHRVYDMSEHGVPQIRTRVIFGDAPELPILDEIPLREVLSRCGCAVTTGDMQTNGTVRKGRKGKGTARKPTRPPVYQRASLDAVSRTVTSCYPSLLRSERLVTLPNRVVCELQTFDAAYFPLATLKKGVARRMIANSVPPVLAASLIRHIEEAGMQRGAPVDLDEDAPAARVPAVR
ncbi:S-adenosyl-L-methionine-dependent methyltransferase [Tribonema minus]|uniref:DNA (cytosine-5-)-methyltransferase n=1 Tax=Tribonema minus TaxID=303371 RepID=A0A836CNB4_9STRA|nr:S-adenosyl-L-methionine-dependent methyltransferase [Tribonema minus]